jgi:hypothetical protein
MLIKDGQLIKNSQALPYVLQRGDKFYIARHYGGPNTVQLYKGSIDDLRIYNHALTEAEVMELYNGNPTAGTVDLSAALTADYNAGTNGRVQINNALTYAATITNNGLNVASNARVIFYFPPRNVSINTNSMPSGCVIANGRSVTCSVGDLAAGVSISRAITVTYTKSGGASISALALTDSNYVNATNNFSRVVTAIKPNLP